MRRDYLIATARRPLDILGRTVAVHALGELSWHAAWEIVCAADVYLTALAGEPLASTTDN